MIQKKYPPAVAMGSVKSARKAMASAKNGVNGHRTALVKCAYFEKIFPYPLINNEWKVKFPVGVTKTGRVATYNPDYFCPKLKSYIEVTTSIQNMGEQGHKWEKVIRDGVPLRVYWWEGEEITARYGRPKKSAPKQ